MGIKEAPVQAACNVLSQLFLSVNALAVKHKALPRSQPRQPTLPDIVNVRHEVPRLKDQIGDSQSLRHLPHVSCLASREA